MAAKHVQCITAFALVITARPLSTKHHAGAAPLWFSRVRVYSELVLNLPATRTILPVSATPPPRHPARQFLPQATPSYYRARYYDLHFSNKIND